MKVLQELCDKLNIKSNTFQKACELSSKIENSGETKGSKINVKTATILLIACKLTDNQKDVKEIFKICNTDIKEINKFYKKIKHLVPCGAIFNSSCTKFTDTVSKQLNL